MPACAINPIYSLLALFASVLALGLLLINNVKDALFKPISAAGSGSYSPVWGGTQNKFVDLCVIWYMVRCVVGFHRNRRRIIGMCCRYEKTTSRYHLFSTSWLNSSIALIWFNTILNKHESTVYSYYMQLNHLCGTFLTIWPGHESRDIFLFGLSEYPFTL